MQDCTERANLLITLAPHFRLVRLLYQEQNRGSLDSIDALLGCGVACPHIDPDLGLDSFGFQDSKKIINCLFYTINWFREIISAFVTQKDKNIRQKVLIRITNLIELEEKIKDLSKGLPDHKFPTSHFYNIDVNTTTTMVSHDTEKVKRKKPNMNVSRVSSQAGATQVKPGRKVTKEKEIVRHYRELDTDLIQLLKHPLQHEEKNDEKEICLTIPQFIFIMQDLVLKLQTSSGSLNLSHFNRTVETEALIRDCVQLMPFIDGHLLYIQKAIQDVLTRCDGIYDSQEMFSEKSIGLKKAFSLILEMISLVFSWSGFRDSNNLTLLRECLRMLYEPGDKTKMSGYDLMMAVIARLTPMIEYCLTLSSAVAVINILKAFTLAPVQSTVGIKEKLRLLSGKLLERKWYTLDGLVESGAAANLALNTLIVGHLEGSDINVVANIVACLHDDVPKLVSKEDCLGSFHCINKLNFPMLYRGICSALLDALRSEVTKGNNL